MRAFILCAGLGTRMRPLTHGLPKAAMPFLNLPLLSLGWLYLEKMGMSEAALNSHLFPEKLAETVDFLRSPRPKSARAAGQGDSYSKTSGRPASLPKPCRAKILFEPESLGSAGGLFNAMRRSLLKEEEDFFYLNGDSLFFPSSFEALARFKESFRADERAEGLFFAAPPPPEERRGQLTKGGYLWAGRDFALRAIGSERKIRELGFAPRWPGSLSGRPGGRSRGLFIGPASRPLLDLRRVTGFSSGAGLEGRPASALRYLKSLKPNELAPLKFSGLAAFKGRFLSRLSEKNLNPEEAHVFHNVIDPLLKKRLFKVFADFSDQGGVVLEGGEKSGFLQASGLAMEALFSRACAAAPADTQAAAAGEKSAPRQPKKSGIRSILESAFQRFDPDDELAGLKSGKKWAAEHGTPLLAPASVQGLSHLKAEGFAVIGPGARLSGPSFLKESVLGAGVCWRGALEKDIIIKFAS